MRYWLVVGLLLRGAALQAQGVLLLEQRFGADSSQRAVVVLKRQVVYRAELLGAGDPQVQPVAASGRPAFIVPVDTLNPTVRRFEIYALEAGPHTVTLVNLPAGASALFRLYHDSSETRRIAAKREQTLRLGVWIAGGYHGGYRVDSTGSANPRGGRSIEGCLLLETGTRFATCIGAGGERLPDAAYSVTWLFLEERVRIVTARLLGARRTDLGGALRLGEAFNVGPRGIAPGLVSWGLYASQGLAAAGGSSGLRLVLGWQRSSIGNTRAQPRHYGRLSAGLVWIP